VLQEGGAVLKGAMTHAGSSYELDTPEALRRLAEQERRECVRAAERLRAAGLSCPEVSIGSTPTALSAAKLDGVTEVRAGVYALFDLVMANVGVCTPQDIALSVLTTVIGHQAEKGWTIVDAGWMAMSRDRGTQRQKVDYGYGAVGDVDGNLIDGLVLTGANQEHGIVSRRDGRVDPDMMRRLPVGTRLRILPNHACATGAQFPGISNDHRAGCRATMETFRWLVRSFTSIPRPWPRRADITAIRSLPAGSSSSRVSCRSRRTGASSTKRRSSSRRSRFSITSRMP
jgi:D-serine deaminase-like pyridoxal phosphate-dependent protein